ncbi:hypothetical protein [Zhihengliuella salsuginis]|uniref:Uncharacterized protein n=1 Tax=Zhihengliuella salsuginis TaxID=578222 RepID=A0ABQ3GCP7_9MICC|nr:hypothetical protein [Zhihengliuella salsuginis]GHD01483.1 hypothetical protein GCM10008096_05650 [Zhihengliuella salsuginis]
MNNEHEDAVSTWIPVLREDRETVGYLEPDLDSSGQPDYDRLQPRDVLGHKVGGAADFIDGEERLLEHGISHVAGAWRLAGPMPAMAAAGAWMSSDLTIVEISPNGIIATDLLAAKSLTPTERITVPWPDLEQRLIPVES